ncbi:squalene--hopene cyclase [Pseudoduganella eburnea]|uniref:Squalene--hopene cyclase n=1 Tax=Massilia eburnea TaxID=1776165 RepID=A0A6L6QCJ0_9BURK|nr:squalene--hopene cyclase [Massilia eburnea]
MIRPPVVVLTGMAFEARIADAPAVYGQRGKALEDALAARLQRPCAGLISFGVAGGLAPALQPGAIVVADSVATAGETIPTDGGWSAALLRALDGASLGPVAGVDSPLAAVAEKAALNAALGALAADMESHIGARAARQAGVPFAVLRVVIDAAGSAVPPAALAGFGADGRTDMRALLANLLAHPWQLGAMLRLARDSAHARAALRDARASLGARFGLPETPG